MPLRAITLAISVLALTVGAQFPSTQTAVAVPQSVASRAAGGETVPVIVGVQMAFRPEGELGGAAGMTLQRETIQRALDAVTSRAMAAGVNVTNRFSSIPYFTASVNQAQLQALASTPGVSEISEDALERPMLAQSVPLISANTSHAAGYTGSGWAVAILDTGVEKTHAFFGGRVVSEACYSNAGGGGAASGGSSVCPGGVFTSTATGSGVPCSAAVGGCNHGTHVAGIAAGSGGLGGMTGVAPAASIIAIQVFTRFDSVSECSPSPSPCALAFRSDTILGLERVLALAGSINVASANMSLGGGGPYTTNCDTDPTIGEVARKAAIDNLLSVGVATAIAAGNNGFTNTHPDGPGVSAPACISTAIAVGSTTKTDLVSSFTNRAPGMVDLLAPGSSINSSVPLGAYAIVSGTSMATPHVAGAWAVLKQAVPAANVAQVLSALQSTGAPINDPLSDQGQDFFAPQATYQRINVNAARLALAGNSAPGAPGTPTVFGSGNNITFNWTAPTTGGAPTSYSLVARATCGGGVLVTLPVGNVITFSVTPPPSGTFCVTVQASNASGAGPESGDVTFTLPVPPAPPGAPRLLTAGTLGQRVTLSWLPPTTGGVPTGYRATVTGPISGVFDLPNATAFQAPGLPGGSYSLSLQATNAGGAGPASNTATFMIGAVAPIMNVPQIVGSNVTLSWTRGTGGSTPTGYIVRARLSPAGPIIASLNSFFTTITVGAPGGTYYVTVQALADTIMGPESNQVTVVVP